MNNKQLAINGGTICPREKVHPVCASCESTRTRECRGVDPAMPEAEALDKCSICHERRKGK